MTDGIIISDIFSSEIKSPESFIAVIGCEKIEVVVPKREPTVRIDFVSEKDGIINIYCSVWDISRSDGSGERIDTLCREINESNKRINVFLIPVYRTIGTIDYSGNIRLENFFGLIRALDGIIDKESYSPDNSSKYIMLEQLRFLNMRSSK